VTLAQIDELHVHAHVADTTHANGSTGLSALQPRMPAKPAQPVEVVEGLDLRDSLLFHGGHIALGAELVLHLVITGSTGNRKSMGMVRDST